MSNNTSVTDQVNTAIASAHKNINAASHLAPADESKLREMSSEIKAKIDDLVIAGQTLSSYLRANGQQKPTYS